MHEIFLTNKHLHDINPLSCGKQICESGHRFGPAQRDYYLLHYIQSGMGTLQVASHRYQVTAGQIFIIRPLEITVYQADLKNPWHYSWIGFESRLPLGSWIHENVINATHCEHIFRNLCQNTEAAAEKEYYLCGRIYELISILSKPTPPNMQNEPEFVLKTKNYIEANYIHDISIENMASSLNLNRSYFSTTFRKHIGKSPQQFLVDLRLSKAAELLASRHFSPSEAAVNCGYKDLFTFSKMFKKKYGIPPGQYARLNMANLSESDQFSSDTLA